MPCSTLLVMSVVAVELEMPGTGDDEEYDLENSVALLKGCRRGRGNNKGCLCGVRNKKEDMKEIKR